MNSAASDSPPPTKVYVSAVDLWIATVLVLGPIVSAASGIYLWTLGRADSAMLLFLVGAAAAAITAILVVPCRYTLTEDSLAIRCGILISRVNWDDVTSVAPSRSLASGPALSLRRVALVVHKTKPGGSPSNRTRTIVISPRDREEFIRDVNDRIAQQPRSTD